MKAKHPKEVKADQVKKELAQNTKTEQANQYHCFRCGAVIPEKIKREKNKDGSIKGRCPSCKRIAVFCLPEKTESLSGRMEKAIEKEIQKDKECKVLATPEVFQKGEQREEREIKLLKDPDLLVNVTKEIQNEVSGEEDTIAAIIIVENTRLVKNASAESRNLFLSDLTGVGKDYTAGKTLNVVVPDENHYHLIKMSPETFIYWKTNEKDWDWEGKVIHIEDITQALLDCSTFKTIASGGKTAVVVKDQKAIEIHIPGKPVLVITSHHVNPLDEALRRFPIGGLDESPEQTRRIKDKTSRRYSGRDQNKPDQELRHAVQRLLRPYEVIIPYAELIQFFFPDSILMRTHYRRFLDYICSSAVFHQYQREKDKGGRLIATSDDYMLGRFALIYSTSNPRMISVSKEYKDVLTILQDNIEPMTVQEIFLKGDKPKIWLYRHLPELKSAGLIEVGTRPNERANKDDTTYQFSPASNINTLPTWMDLINNIHKIIDNTDKTDNTPPSFLQDREYYQSLIKLIIPNDDEERVLSSIITGDKTSNRKVLSVFSVFSSYLRERDEKRYKKYYEDRPATEEKTTQTTLEREKTVNNPRQEKKSQHQRMNEIKEYLQREVFFDCGVSQTALYDNFLPSDIDQAIRSELLIKLPNGNYQWGG